VELQQQHKLQHNLRCCFYDRDRGQFRIVRKDRDRGCGYGALEASTPMHNSPESASYGC
jgi:hypothetical protein